VKIGLSYNTGYHGLDPEKMVAMAQHAEACGQHPVVLAKRLATIDVLRLLWAGDENGVSYAGEFFSFTNLCSYPKPYRVAGLPIHVGGSSRAAARRAGRRGDGYFPGGALMPQERSAQLEVMRMAALEAGRDPATLDYTRWGSIEMTPEGVEARARQGITRLVVGTSATDLNQQRVEISALADRLRLDPGT
jgi:alkanesulfonate monooxygenase SsuD/methylene tetrahydromethanopterin reductase-like flavin-dependent oxidoreductase (luciferase family)